MSETNPSTSNATSLCVLSLAHERKNDDEVAKIAAALKDPETVYVNMMRGVIAKPRLRSMIELYRTAPRVEDSDLLELASLQAENARLKQELIILKGREDQSYLCWSCKELVTLEARRDNDGNCPHCDCELDLSDWPRR